MRVKIVSKPLGSTKYHLATFNQRVSRDANLPRHVVEEVAFKLNITSIQVQVPELALIQQQDKTPGAIQQDFNTNENRKRQKLKYVFEELVDDREPQKFNGYLDETMTADSAAAGGNANYAIMIYDVHYLDKINLTYRLTKTSSSSSQWRDTSVSRKVPFTILFIRPLVIQPRVKPALIPEPVADDATDDAITIRAQRLKAAMATAPKASKIGAKRQLMNRIFSDQSKYHQ